MLKSLVITLMLTSGVTAYSSAPQVSFNETLTKILVQDARGLIDWKLGDSADYNVSLVFGGGGTMHKEVTKDEGTSLWITQKAQIMGQSQVVEIQIDKDTGKVLKVIVNGKEEPMTDDQFEVISQDYTNVTVPAGTFKVMHIVAKTPKIDKIEIWANPQEVVMDGAVKQALSSPFGTITFEMTAQHKAE